MTVSPRNRCRRKQTLHGYPSFHVSPLLNNAKIVQLKDLVTEISNPHSGFRTHSASRSSPKCFRDCHVSRASLLGTPSLPLKGPVYVAPLTKTFFFFFGTRIMSVMGTITYFSIPLETKRHYIPSPAETRSDDRKSQTWTQVILHTASNIFARHSYAWRIQTLSKSILTPAG